MATLDEWAAFFSGYYQGWIRSPASEWEDLIGLVKIECAANPEGSLKVTIVTVEFGMWTGNLRLEGGLMKGSTGQGDTYFQFAFQEREQRGGIQGCFHGGIYKPPAEALFELHLVGDWRKRHPELG